jgi:hypothetical protein
MMGVRIVAPGEKRREEEAKSKLRPYFELENASWSKERAVVHTTEYYRGPRHGKRRRGGEEEKEES